MADRLSDALNELKAIRNCLGELEGHAQLNGAQLAANLIGAASKALEDEIFEREATPGISRHYFGIRYDA